MPVTFPKEDARERESQAVEPAKPRRTTEIRFSLHEPVNLSAADKTGVGVGAAAGAEDGAGARRSRAKSTSRLVRRMSRHIRAQSRANVLEGLGGLGTEEDGSEVGEGEYEEEEDEGEEEEEYEGEVEEESPPPTPTMKKLTREYAPDAAGGIHRAALLKLDESILKKLVHDMRGHVERVKSENIVMERTLDAMEARDREIEANIPKFAYQYPWEKTGDARTSGEAEAKKLTTEVCQTESSTEEETEEDEEEGSDQDQQIFHPRTDLNLEDPMFEGMSEESREALQKFVLSVGDVAPENFDVIQYKYKNLVRPATAGDGGANPAALHDHDHHRGHGKQGGTDAGDNLASQHDLEADGASSRKRSTKTGKKHQSRKSRASRQYGMSRPSSDDSIAIARQRNLMEQDVSTWSLLNELEKTMSEEEFPDFDSKTADELPLRFKNQLMEEQIPIMISEWGEQRLTQAYKDSTRVLVYIDSYQTSYVMVRQLILDLHKLHEKSVHPVTHRLKAESLQLFMKQMKSFLMSEASKRWMEWQELRKNKRNIDTQLRQNEELGESLHLIDFDKLRIENSQLVHDMEENHEWIQKLKLINANCMENLKQSKSKLFRQLTNHKMIEDSTNVRRALKNRFEKETRRKEEEIFTAKQRIKFFQRRLRAFRTPNLLDYIAAKGEEQILSQEKKSMQLKIDTVKAAGARVKQGFGNFENFPAPLRKDIHAINLEWLEAMKKEVRERSLMKLINECDDEAFAKEILEAGSRQKPAKPSRRAGYTGEKRVKKNPLLSRTTLISVGVENATATPMSIKASKRKTTAWADIDDAALIKSKLPVPTPGNLILLAQQQEREDKEFERLSKLKSEAKTKSAHSRGGGSRKIQPAAPPTEPPQPQPPRPSAVAPPRPSVAFAPAAAGNVAPRKSVTIGQMDTQFRKSVMISKTDLQRRKSMAIDETYMQRRKSSAIEPTGVHTQRRKSMAAPVGRGSSAPPPAAYMSKRRMTIEEVKSTHAAKMKDEDQLVLQAGALAEAAGHR